MPERSSPVPALAEASEILPVSALIQASRPSPVIPYVSERSSSVPALAEAPKFPHTIALPVLRRKRVQRVNTVAKSEETPEELRKIQEAIRENVESQLKLLGAELSINFHRENLGKAVTTVARLIYTRNNRRNEEDALLAVYAASMIVLRLAPWSIEDISRNALERQSENFKKANAFVSERNLFNFNRRISFHIPSPSFAVAR
ncbi:MAG: hypothetical protein Q7S63_02565 [bacterium]|nr:hypothetical protein [bacterium]